MLFVFFFFQAEDGIRDLVRSRGLGDVYKRQELAHQPVEAPMTFLVHSLDTRAHVHMRDGGQGGACLLYTSDAADERSSVDLGGRRIF